MTTVDQWDGTDGAADGGESEDYIRIPYPQAWDRDPDDGTDPPATGGAGPDTAGDEDSEGFGRELDAAYAWYRAVELLINQGFPAEACEAEVMRRCGKVSRRQRTMMRDVEQEERSTGSWLPTNWCVSFRGAGCARTTERHCGKAAGAAIARMRVASGVGRSAIRRAIATTRRPCSWPART
ncbi:MAG: hypothetical protein ACRDQ7_07910 [Haloechinothrix sp.]